MLKVGLVISGWKNVVYFAYPTLPLKSFTVQFACILMQTNLISLIEDILHCTACL